MLAAQISAEHHSSGRYDKAFPRTECFAFSADADHAAFSRRVTDIDFSDPVHPRFGNINKLDYNWIEDPCNVKRFARGHYSLNLFDRLHLLFPTYLVYRLPADLLRSRRCWRCTILWPRESAHYDVIDHAGVTCRDLTPSDVGQRIYAVSIKRNQPLAMNLHAGGAIQLHSAYVWACSDRASILGCGSWR